MDQKEQIQKQRQMIAEQRRLFYEENPDLARWVKNKRVIRNIILIYWVLHTVFTIIVMLQMGSSGSIVLEIVKLLFQMLWICVFVNPEGSWRFSLILYLWALGNFVMLLQQGADIMDSLAYISYQPLYGIILIMEVMVPFLFLAIAIYLTALPKNRELSERVYELQKQTSEMMKKMGSGKEG